MVAMGRLPFFCFSTMQVVFADSIVDSKPSERKSSFHQGDMWVKIDKGRLGHSGFLSKAEETD
jgi:hypothetical protein